MDTDILERPSKTTTSTKPYCCPNGKQVDVHVNEDNEERRLQDPIIYDPEDYPEDKLRDAMQREMASMKDFGVYEEVPLDEMHNHDNGSIIQTKVGTSLERRTSQVTTSSERLRRTVHDVDDTYASTPVLVILRTLITSSLTHGWTMTTGDISTAFLHAPITKDEGSLRDTTTRVLPKWGYSVEVETCNVRTTHVTKNLARPLCRSTTTMWFEYALKSDPNVYADYKHKVYVLVYVDDVFFFGPQRPRSRQDQGTTRQGALET